VGYHGFVSYFYSVPKLRIWPKTTSLLLVPMLPLGNEVFEAPASRRMSKQELGNQPEMKIAENLADITQDARWSCRKRP